jgi:HSP20 family protein
MLMRYDPFREFERLTQQAWGAGSRTAMMPMDAYRRSDRLVAHFDLPGVDPDSVEVTIEKNVLSVKAERSFPPAEGDEILISERAQGSFARQVFLGEGLDVDHIEARYEHGVLTLTIPVAEQAKPRKVAINVTDDARKVSASTSA